MVSSATFSIQLILVPIFQAALVMLTGAAVSIHFPAVDAKRWEDMRALDRVFSLNFYFTLGCAVLCFLFAVAGHARLDTSTLTLIAAIPAFSALFHGRRAWIVWPRPEIPPGIPARLVLLALAVMVLMNALGTLSPEVRFDPLAYHLQVPRLWLNMGRMVEVPENGHSYFPYGFEMLYAWSLSLGSDSAAKAMHFAAGVSGALWCARIGRRIGASPLYAAALYYFIHSISYLSTTTYIDLATGMYALAAIAILVESFHAPLLRATILVGIFTGAAMTTKYTAWPLVGVPVGLAVIALSRRRPAHVVAFAIAALIPLLPWAARNVAYVGNPVAPLMVRFFGPQSAIDTGLAGSFDAFAGKQTGVVDLLLAPVFYARHLMLQKYVLSLLGMGAGLLLMIAQKKSPHEFSREVRFLLLLLIGSFLAEALFTRGHPDGRYGLASMGIGAVLIAVLCARMNVLTASKGACVAAPLLCLALFGSALRDRSLFQESLKESWYPILSEGARDEYRANHDVQPANFVELEKRLLREHAGRVLGINYPSTHRYWVWIQGMRNDPVAGGGGAQATAEKIHESLVRLGFTHIVNKTNPGFDEAGWLKFLNSYTAPVEAGGADVRAIKRLTSPSP